MRRRVGNRCPRLHLRVAVGLFVVVLTLLVARPALADYSIDKVGIDATVQTNGTLDVQEQRTFDFDGSYHGVYWEIPKGDYEGRTVQVSVESAGEIVDGAYRPFSQSNSGQDGTYQLTDEGSTVKVKIYSAHEDESATFVVEYSDTNLASRWSDTGELYWKFVSDGWDVESQNVTCTIHLPVPSAESVSPGDNVRAWGHGPLDASLAFNGNDVVYTVPGVGTDEYAEARIVFPQAWLSAATQSSTAKLDSILQEEQAAADEANAARRRARMALVGATVASVLIAVLLAVYAVRRRRSYLDSHRPLFDDKYFRDVPSDDHPAVLGALLRDGTAGGEDFSASLMRLSDMGVIALDEVKPMKKGLLKLGKAKGAYRISRLKPLPDAAGSSPQQKTAHQIDAATMKFAFDVVGAGSKKVQLEDGSSLTADQMLMTDFETFAHESPQEYSDAYEDWKNQVFAAYATRGFMVDDQTSGKGKLEGAGAAGIVAGLVLLFLMIGMGAGPLGLVALAPIVAGVACCLVAIGFKERSKEAIELTAKLNALRNWLCDFTRLKEAVPHDVILWNRLLVMAVVLGVSDKVIKQLKVAAPEVLDSPDIMPVYCWYYMGGGYGPGPLSTMTDVLNQAHSVSTAALAASSESSGSGLGGGFSVGGGGGFGGGGGGGAF